MAKIHNKHRIPSCRRFNRSTDRWETVKNDYSDKRFKENFRVSKETFYFIFWKICSDTEKKETAETPISVEMHLGVCLYKLSRGDYNYTLY